MAPSKRDQRYLAILVEALQVCKRYRPKLGHGGREGYSLPEFRRLYGDDPFYHWMGLESPLMYAAHKAAGGMTSVYRQIGIGCERLFREVLKDTLKLSAADTEWSYKIRRPDGRTRTLSLDGRIPRDAILDPTRRTRVQEWINESAERLEIDDAIRGSLKGIVFEVRQGYKSKDSKRQNADIANVATAYTRGYLPCVALLSQQIDERIALRYASGKWKLLVGITGDASPHQSFYAFMKTVVGYDLARFFERNRGRLKKEVHSVLQTLLTATGP